MGDIRTEPSMEEILASIKRIIADDGLALNGRAAPRADIPPPLPALESSPDPVLELTDTVVPPVPTPSVETPSAAPEPGTVTPAPVAGVEAGSTAFGSAAQAKADPVAHAPAAAPPPADPATLVSEDAACASRQSLSNLSSMVLRTPGTDNTLDGLVRELLRPLLKEWLDARLPGLVESLVAREIARITGKAL